MDNINFNNNNSKKKKEVVANIDTSTNVKMEK